MIRRRSVLASTLIVPVAAHALGFEQAMDLASQRQAAAPRYVVLDQTSEPAEDLAAHCADTGASVLHTGADLTSLYLQLYRELAAEPFALAGATTGNAFFVLERLGWDRGLRTAFRGHQREQALQVWQSGDWLAGGLPSSQLARAQRPPSAAGMKPLFWLLVPR